VSQAPVTRPRRVGLDNYGLFPLELSPLDTLKWAVAHRADGVAFSGLTDRQQADIGPGSLADLRMFAADHDLYLEWGGGQHIPRDMTTWASKDLFAVNRRAAQEAQQLGTRVVRSCSGGLMRWNDASPPTDVLLRDTAAALRAQASMLRDHDVVLAIETHFEFTTFELLRLFDMCEVTPGDWLGICLDTMNLLTMLEDPVLATARVLPWVVSTHIKDGGVLVGRDGLTTFPMPVGSGVIDLGSVLGQLDSLPADVHLSVEDHGGSFHLPIHDALFLAKFPDLAGAELTSLINLSEVTAGNAACRPVDRSAWPDLCERRMAQDLIALQALSRQVEARAQTAARLDSGVPPSPQPSSPRLRRDKTPG
jgi:sugar phosphate isomerase/epimerase